MNEKNLKIIRYLTGAIFAVQFIVSAVNLAGRLGWYSWYQKPACIVEVLGILLMAVSLFIGTHSLLAIGAGMQSVGILLSIIFEIIYCLRIDCFDHESGEKFHYNWNRKCCFIYHKKFLGLLRRSRFFLGGSTVCTQWMDSPFGNCCNVDLCCRAEYTAE